MTKGWNTWHVRSVLTHVCLPEGAAIMLGIKDYSTGRCLREALIGRQGEGDERIIPGPHAYDGSYTSLELAWGSLRLKIETAVENGDWYARINRPKADRKRQAGRHTRGCYLKCYLPHAASGQGSA